MNPKARLSRHFGDPVSLGSIALFHADQDHRVCIRYFISDGEGYQSGRTGTVSKAVVGQPTVGSNPTPSALNYGII